jgi:lipid A 3-O-deacylase
LIEARRRRSLACLRPRAVLVFFAAIVISGLTMGAQMPEIQPHEYAANFTFENDVFFHTDHYYTNGVQLEVDRRTDGRSSLMRRLTSSMCRPLACNSEGTVLLATRYRAGQLMYTPTNIADAAPQPFDRPWAGLLYLASDYPFLSQDKQTLTTIFLEGGVTGPIPGQ